LTFFYFPTLRKNTPKIYITRWTKHTKVYITPGTAIYYSLGIHSVVVVFLYFCFILVLYLFSVQKKIRLTILSIATDRCLSGFQRLTFFYFTTLRNKLHYIAKQTSLHCETNFTTLRNKLHYIAKQTSVHCETL